MRKLMGLALAGMLFFSVSAIAGKSQVVENTFDVNPGDSLTVKNINGKVQVVAWDRDQVEVVATKKANKGWGKSKMEFVDIEMSQEGDSILVETVQRKKNTNVSVTYEIRVPARMNLDLKSTNGKVTVDGVDGNVMARTTNGSISLDEISGNIEAKTTNGSIKAVLVSHDGGEIRCKTTNGSIKLDLPDDIKGALNASTTNGRISTDLPIEIAGSVSKRRMNGIFNGGGTPIELKTTNGSISIN